jgi:phosphoribosylformimino-5-aminoimidazole carboxamide ribotide isomerase
MRQILWQIYVIKTTTCDKFAYENFFTIYFIKRIVQIIPVIDLMQNQVVHAKYGKRGDYQAIQSTLCSGADPFTILAALLKLYPFQTIYIADIDAIIGAGNHTELIESLSQAHPTITFWLDCGIKQMNARELYNTSNIKPVLGSENIESLQVYRAISYACESKHVLSLDYSATSAMGIADLHSKAHFWPDDTICMTLNAVGSENGVDIETLKELMRLNSARKTPSRLYAAGGVRNLEDLKLLADMGVQGALVATALHRGQFTTQQLSIFT